MVTRPARPISSGVDDDEQGVGVAGLGGDRLGEDLVGEGDYWEIRDTYHMMLGEGDAHDLKVGGSIYQGTTVFTLPDLSEMQLAPGEDPALVPEFLMSYQGIETWAAMSDEAIGLSVGAGEQNTLVDFLEMKPGPEGVFLSADYDSSAYYDYQDAAMAGAGVDAGHDSSPTHSISEAFTAAAREYSDRNHVTMSFTSKGLVIENEMTFKK